MCAFNVYLSLGLDFCNFDHWVHGEVLIVLLVHLAVHPDHGIVYLLVHPGHLQLIQMIIELVLLGHTKVNLTNVWGFLSLVCDTSDLQLFLKLCIKSSTTNPGYLCLVSFNYLHVHLDLSPKLLKRFRPLLSFHVSLVDRLTNFLLKQHRQ